MFTEHRNRFRWIDYSSLSLSGRYDKQGCRTGPPVQESIPGLLKRFTKTGLWPVRQIGLSLRPGRLGINSWGSLKCLQIRAQKWNMPISVQQQIKSKKKNWIAYCSYSIKWIFSIISRVAQWKRAGPITQRSVDRNHALLECFFSIIMTDLYVTVLQDL